MSDVVSGVVGAGVLQLPERVRSRLAELYRLKVQADRDLLGPLSVAVEMLGLDAAGAHVVDFDTGKVTVDGGAAGVVGQAVAGDQAAGVLAQ